ncbi:MAG: hypothetical protein D6729_04115 [Deltaproteobacteria bacterium]|nr:MAG: hypothetical protein D6729_04115 [Deltaproteobacteria bacterium]
MLLPAAARAQSVEAVLLRAGLDACARAACSEALTPSAERVVAFELLGGPVLNLSPPQPLAPPSSRIRVGPEARLFVGLPNSGYEVAASVAYLATNTQGVLRAGLGLGANLGSGPVQAYALGLLGVWGNLDAQPDAWSPAAAIDLRGAMGVRIRAFDGVRVVAEFSTGTLGGFEAQGGPFFELRLGIAFGSPRRQPKALAGEDGFVPYEASGS